MACLLAALFYLLSANGRAAWSIWNAGTRALAAQHTDRAKISARELFGANITGVCIFVNGYREGARYLRRGDVDATITHMKEAPPIRHLSNWAIYLDGRRGLRLVELSVGGPFQIEMPDQGNTGTCFDASQPVEVSLSKVDDYNWMIIDPPQ